MSFFVRTADREIRQRIIDDLEKVGFTPDNHSNKSDILESRFPLSIDMEKKAYSSMGNVTCAACAASCGKILTPDEFYENCRLPNDTFR